MTHLNTEQMAAAKHDGGHALVLSGPGTGKTRTLVARFAHLVMNENIPSDRILTTTFTSKAANELKEKISEQTGKTKGMWVGTFHSICMRLLRKYGPDVGLERNFSVLGERDQKELIRSLDWNEDLGDLVEIIGRWKEGMITPERALETAKQDAKPNLVKAAQHYAAYESMLDEQGLVDFADLILKAIEALERSKSAQKWAASFVTILVDEFQDTNALQIALLKAFMSTSEVSIWAVADDDQSIYAWRSADVRYTLKFKKYFRGATVYKLSRNYRSTPIIVAGANALISHNRSRWDKQLIAQRPPNGNRDLVTVNAFTSERREADWVVSQVVKLQKAGVSSSEIAILFRTASVCSALQKALFDQKIPFVLRGAQNFWTLPEVKLVIRILDMIRQPSLLSEFTMPGNRGYILRDLVEKMKGSSLQECAAAVGTSVGQSPPASMDDERQSMWTDAAELAAAEAAKFDDFSAFFEYADACSKNPANDLRDAISLTTVHSAKGLEYYAVFIIGCEARLWPHSKADDLEEERRLFYVAATRAKRFLFFTWSGIRFAKSQVHSRFIDEFIDGAMHAPGVVKWPNRPERKKGVSDDEGSKAGKRRGGAYNLRENANNINSSSKQEGPSKGSGRKERRGRMTIYRRRGGRSLIPPEEEGG